MLMGLDFLASQDMIHRDITCSTMLLSLRGDVKVGRSSLTYGLRVLLIFSSKPILKGAPTLVHEAPSVSILKL